MSQKWVDSNIRGITPDAYDSLSKYGQRIKDRYVVSMYLHILFYNTYASKGLRYLSLAELAKAVFTKEEKAQKTLDNLVAADLISYSGEGGNFEIQILPISEYMWQIEYAKYDGKRGPDKKPEPEAGDQRNWDSLTKEEKLGRIVRGALV